MYLLGSVSCDIYGNFKNRSALGRFLFRMNSTGKGLEKGSMYKIKKFNVVHCIKFRYCD